MCLTRRFLAAWAEVLKGKIWDESKWAMKIFNVLKRKMCNLIFSSCALGNFRRERHSNGRKFGLMLLGWNLLLKTALGSCKTKDSSWDWRVLGIYVTHYFNKFCDKIFKCRQNFAIFKKIEIFACVKRWSTSKTNISYKASLIPYSHFYCCDSLL